VRGVYILERRFVCGTSQLGSGSGLGGDFFGLQDVDIVKELSVYIIWENSFGDETLHDGLENIGWLGLERSAVAGGSWRHSGAEGDCGEG
jgi:hypothetical protein